jgi:putative ABC transport system permease protein
MFRNYLAAALRNLSRNRLYAGITIAGLAVGLAAAMLIGLFVRDELTYDRWVPDHDRVFLVTETLSLAGSKPIETQSTPVMMVPRLKLEFPEIEYTARMVPPGFPVIIKHGEITGSEEHMYWADPDFFRVLPMPTVAGTLASALDSPDGMVLTAAIARKYFGREDTVGETLLMNGRPYRVTAVVKDLPSNTHLTAELWVSSKGPVGPIAQYGPQNLPLANNAATYFKLKPGASIAPMLPQRADFLQNRLPVADANLIRVERTLHFVPLTKIHVTRSTQSTFKPQADPAVLTAIGLVGVLIVVVAAINFVTLMTARAARRAVEVGVRKAVGASRRDLFLQFMGEALLHVLAATVLALSLAELLMPAVDAFLQSRLKLDYLHDASLLAAIAAAVVLTALLAGAYPALILSSFRPSSVLKGGPAPTSGGSRVRQALVVGQFAVLIGLFLVAITIARQTRFALNEGMRVNHDQVLLLFSQPCIEPVRDEARKLPGVRYAACASYEALNRGDNRDLVPVRGRPVDISFAPVDFQFFEAFGVKPLDGRLFDPARPGDGARYRGSATLAPVVINETAVRNLGFASPQAAIGQTVQWHGIWYNDDVIPTSPGPLSSEIIGVVPDFTFGSVRQEIRPMLYQIGKAQAPHSIAMVLKLDGKRLPETLARIDALWKRLGQGKPELRIFLQDYQQRLYTDTIIQGGTIAMAAGIALTVACLGLFALSAFTAERRTKEIGIRKAMGANSADILKLLLWQFTKAVLVAIVIALPAAYLVMQWWLKGFVYHVSPAAWTFAAAAVGAILIAWITVFTQTWRVARAKPVSALRYE